MDTEYIGNYVGDGKTRANGYLITFQYVVSKKEKKHITTILMPGKTEEDAIERVKYSIYGCYKKRKVLKIKKVIDNKIPFIGGTAWDWKE